MNTNEAPRIVKKEITTSKNSDIIRVGQNFRKEFLSLTTGQDDGLLDIPISAIRIIFKIVSDLRHSQFQSKQTKQLSLFDSDFKTENNTYAQFKIRTSDINGKNGNVQSIKDGLEFLVKYKEGWYTAENNKKKKISVFGGLIRDPSISEGDISFLVSSYWIEKLIHIDAYNEAIYQIAWKISSSKHILFYLWLLEIDFKGTIVNYQTINTRFGLNYSSARDIAREFFKPMRIKFNLYGNRSFNYSVKGEKLAIVPYAVTAPLIDLKVETVESLVVKQKITYWRKRHSLNEDQSNKIKSFLSIRSQFELLEIAYKDLVSNFRKSNKKITEVIGGEFLSLFQKSIENRYYINNLQDIIKDIPIIL